MGKKIFLLFLVIFFISPGVTFASDNFSTSYDTTYEIQEDGSVNVLEKITLKNLTKDYFPQNFKLTLNSKQISNISAKDSTGSLPVKLTNLDGVSQVEVNFVQQVIGLNKELVWELSYNTKDLSKVFGKSLEIKIPKTASSLNVEKLNVRVIIPKSFGELSRIIPVPIKSDADSKYKFFYFSKEQLLDSGIIINFGSSSFFDFNINYKLINNSFLPSLQNIIVPPSTQNQVVLYKKITPPPLNITVDEDGNFLAWYKLSAMQKLDINAIGSIGLSLNPFIKEPFLSNELKVRYLDNDNYLEKSDLRIKNLISQISDSDKEKETKEKIKIIYKIVEDYAKDEKVSESEINNLFVALSRFLSIPARIIEGYTDEIHIWSEYFDETKGWIGVDSSLEAIGLDRFIFLIRNDPSVLSLKDNKSLQNLEVKPGADFISVPEIDVKILAEDTYLADFPGKISVKITNISDTAFPASDFQITGGNLKILGDAKNTGIIPPFGYAQFDFIIKSDNLFDSFKDEIKVLVGSREFSKQVTVTPIIFFKSAPLFFISAIALIYFIILITFFYRRRKHYFAGVNFKKKKVLPKIDKNYSYKKRKFKKKKAKEIKT